MNAPHSKKSHPAESQQVPAQSTTQTPPQTLGPDTSLTSQEKLLGALAYLGPFFVVPFLKPKSPFCRFHANQGFAFFITLFAVLILSSLSWIFSMLLSFGYLAVMFYAMYQAYQGQMWKIPVLSDIAEKINIVKLADGWMVPSAGKAPEVPSTPARKEEQPKQ